MLWRHDKAFVRRSKDNHNTTWQWTKDFENKNKNLATEAIITTHSRKREIKKNTIQWDNPLHLLYVQHYQIR